MAILPWGAIEPHNLHLPYLTDCILSHDIAVDAALKAWERYGVHCMVMPFVSMGSQNPGQRELPFCVHSRYETQKAILTDFLIMTERFLQRSKICVNQLLNRYSFSKKMQRIKTDLKFQSCSMPFLKNLKFPMRYAECMRNLNAHTINRWVRSR